MDHECRFIMEDLLSHQTGLMKQDILYVARVMSELRGWTAVNKETEAAVFYDVQKACDRAQKETVTVLIGL